MKNRCAYYCLIGLVCLVFVSCGNESSSESDSRMFDKILMDFLNKHDISYDSIALLKWSVSNSGIGFNEDRISHLQNSGYTQLANISSLINSERFELINVEQLDTMYQKGFVVFGIVNIYKMNDERIVEFQVFCRNGGCCNYDIYRMKQATDGEWELVEILGSSIVC